MKKLWKKSKSDNIFNHFHLVKVKFMNEYKAGEELKKTIDCIGNLEHVESQTIQQLNQVMDSIVFVISSDNAEDNNLILAFTVLFKIFDRKKD